MPSDKIFKNCLLFSFAMHIIVIFGFVPFEMFPHIKHKQKAKEIEVTYYKKIEPAKTARLLPQAIVGVKEKITAPALPYRQKADIQKLAHKQAAPRTEKISVLKNTAITQDKWRVFYESKDLSGQPTYLRYYNLIRNKIEVMANSNKPYVFRVGKINLIFTILDSGDLKNVDIVDNGKGQDPVLMQCALDSVYAASPFPPFPADIKEDHLTIQVPISFEK